MFHPLTPPEKSGQAASGGNIKEINPPEKSGQAASGGNINEIIDPNQWVWFKTIETIGASHSKRKHPFATLVFGLDERTNSSKVF